MVVGARFFVPSRPACTMATELFSGVKHQVGLELHLLLPLVPVQASHTVILTFYCL